MERTFLSFYNTGVYDSWEDANKSGASYDHEFKSNCYTIEELAFAIRDAIDLAMTAIRMMDDSMPFDVAYRLSDSEVDNLRDKTAEEIEALLREVY